MRKLTLKNLKFHEDMSEETACFSADLYEDGKLVAHVKNSGKGGSNDYYPAEGKTWKDIQHLANLDTDCEIMGLAEELNIVQKRQTKALVLKKDGNYFTQKFKISIAQAKKTHLAQLKKEVEKAKAEGFEVLNTNLGF
jgi:hypothetical protein